MKRIFLLVAVLPLFLAGCLTVSPETETKIKAASLEVCQTSAQLEAAYVVLRDNGSLSDATVKKGDKAFAAMNAFCNSSQDWDPNNAALQVALLYVQITAVMKDISEDT